MSLEGPNAGNNLTVNVSIVDGVKIFTPVEPAPENLTWNVNHRRLDIAKPGRYFFTLVAQGFTLASPPIEFKGAHKGMSLYEADSNESSTQATILIATDAAEGERAEFWLLGQDGEIVDPTILVEPPDRPADDDLPGGGVRGTLMVGVAIDPPDSES